MMSILKKILGTAVFAGIILSAAGQNIEQADWLKPIEDPHKDRMLVSFNFDGKDARRNSFPDFNRIADGVLKLEDDKNRRSYLIPLSPFEYDRFSIIFRFKMEKNNEDITHWILTCGGGYRWFGIISRNNDLCLTLNNLQVKFDTGTEIKLNQWYVLAVSFDLHKKEVRMMLNGKSDSFTLPDDFRFNVLGTSMEQRDKNISFPYYHDGTSFFGELDYLRVYGDAILPDCRKETAASGENAESSKPVFEGVFASREPEKRLLALKKYGGSPNTERNVERALEWLASVQNEDGSWGDPEDNNNQKVRLTGYVLQAFLAHGELPGTEPFGGNVKKGLDCILKWSENQKYDCNGINKPIDLCGKAMICTVLAEAFAMTKDPVYENAMNKAMSPLLYSQESSGEFYSYSYDRKTSASSSGDYYYNYEARYDSRIQANAAAFHALFAMNAAGNKSTRLKSGIEKSVFCLTDHRIFSENRTRSDSSSSSFRTYDNGDFQRTAVYTAMLGYFGQSNHTKTKYGLKWLCDFKTGSLSKNEIQKNTELKMDWKSLPCETPALGWYHLTNAVFMTAANDKKSKEWKKWNSSFSKVLPKEQHRDGYWVLPADKYPKSHYLLVRYERDSDGDYEYFKKPKKKERTFNESVKSGNFSGKNGKIWSTALCTLMLEVYYRYEPENTVADQ